MPAEAPDGKYLPPTDYPLERARPCPGPAGSVLIFNYRTIQCASPSAPRPMPTYSPPSPEPLPPPDPMRCSCPQRFVPEQVGHRPPDDPVPGAVADGPAAERGAQHERRARDDAEGGAAGARGEEPPRRADVSAPQWNAERHYASQLVFARLSSSIDSTRARLGLHPP